MSLAWSAKPGGVDGEGGMMIEAKHKAHHDDRDRDERERDERERMRQEEALDEALKNTFPASDPVSAEQPASYRH
jgi:hypothetical protein